MNVKIGINPISWSNDDLPSLGGETPLEVALTKASASATRASSSATSFRASRGAAQGAVGARARARLGLVFGAARRRSVEEEIAAVGPHLSSSPDNGAKVMVYGEVEDSIQGAPQPLYKRPRFFTPRSGTRTRTGSRSSRGTRCRTACASRTTITWARTSSARDVDELMKRVGPEVGLLFDSGHMTVRGRRRRRDAAQAREARVPRALQGRASGRDQASRATQLELSSNR
jgi:inosose dehydratase